MTALEIHTGRSVRRRSVLGLLGTVPVAGGRWAGSAMGGTASATESSSTPDHIPRSLRPGGEFDRLLTQLAARDKLSGTVLLIHRDREVLARSYGMADRQRSISNGPHTLFALGSITKVFTGVAVAQLIQQGRLAYTDTVGAHLDGFPAEIAGKVTVHHLLTHTSGMGDYMMSPDFFTEAATWTSPEQVMDGIQKIIRQASLLSAPGTAWRYSNSGYHVLGAIVARVSGQSYYDYVRDHIFRPAGMTSSGFYTTAQWRTDSRIAHPYTTQRVTPGGRTDAIDYHVYVGSPAGNSFSNAPDLVRFTRALLNHELLTPAWTDLTFSPKVPKPPLAPKPGAASMTSFDSYAASADIVNDHRVIGHNGGAPGIFTNLEWYPDLDWVAVILTNYDRDASSPDTAARHFITQP